jgi:hypothetical protein
MALLATYEDFLKSVNEMGFLPFSNIVSGLPSLLSVTEGSQWHTDDPDTDPWQWRVRAVAEKKLAFGCLLGGHKGFISEAMYPYFYAACNPKEHIEERYHTGEVSQAVWQVCQLFEEGGELDTGDIRKALGKRFSQSKLDSAVAELQREFYITVSGNRRKCNKQGEPYGWPANTYKRVTDWAPSAFLHEVGDIDQGDAVETILNTGVSMGQQVDRDELARKLKLKVRNPIFK